MHRRIIISFMALAFFWACMEQSVQQYAPLTLRVATGLDTKVSAAEGDAVLNVLILLVQDNKLAANPIYRVAESGVNFMDVDCGTLAVGTYEVYAYANILHSDWLPTSSSVEEIEKLMVKGDSFTDSRDRLMTVLTGTAAPAMPTETMILTGTSSILVDITDNNGWVQLHRPVARFNVEVNNHSNAAIQLTSLSFSNFNPSKGFLFAHGDNAGNLTLPSNLSYRSLPAFEGPLDIASDSQRTVYTTLLYEGAASSYTLNATVSMTTLENEHMERSLTNAAMVMVDPVTSLPTPLSQIVRNQDLTVVLNVYYQELEGSFSIEVDNTFWKESGAHNSNHTFR